MSAELCYPHLELRADGKHWLIGTQTKVIEVALDRLAHHWDADEIQRQHPQLTLGQIPAAWRITTIIARKWIESLTTSFGKSSICAASKANPRCKRSGELKGLRRDAAPLHGPPCAIGNHREQTGVRFGHDQHNSSQSE